MGVHSCNSVGGIPTSGIGFCFPEKPPVPLVTYSSLPFPNPRTLKAFCIPPRQCLQSGGDAIPPTSYMGHASRNTKMEALQKDLELAR